MGLISNPEGSVLDVRELVDNTILPRLLEMDSIDDEDSLWLILRIVDLVIPSKERAGICYILFVDRSIF